MSEKPLENTGNEIATLGGGCFWCLETWQGGETPNPKQNKHLRHFYLFYASHHLAHFGQFSR